MCNCMYKGCSSCSGRAWVQCGNPCFSLGPFRATNFVCPPVNTGSIIPFSSGTTTAILATLATGAVGTVTAVGFGTAVPGITPAVNGAITLPEGTVTEAFNVPRAGTITAISATFTETQGLTVAAGTATITAQIYRAPAGSSVFTPTTASVTLTPAVTGAVAVGTVFQGTANTNFPVSAGDRLVMVFSVAGTGITAVTTLTGNATAGITIS